MLPALAKKSLPSISSFKTVSAFLELSLSGEFCWIHCRSVCVFQIFIFSISAADIARPVSELCPSCLGFGSGQLLMVIGGGDVTGVVEKKMRENRGRSSRTEESEEREKERKVGFT